MYKRTLRINRSFIRGQLSLEFLLLFAIFFVALAVLTSAIFNSKNSMQIQLSSMLAEKALSDIKNTINDVCILGDGNKRSLQLYLLQDTSLISSGRQISLIYQNITLNDSILCDTSTNKVEIKDSVISIENKEKRVYITLAKSS